MSCFFPSSTMGSTIGFVNIVFKSFVIPVPHNKSFFLVAITSCRVDKLQTLRYDPPFFKIYDMSGPLSLCPLPTKGSLFLPH